MSATTPTRIDGAVATPAIALPRGLHREQGSELLAEARRLVEQREWKKAVLVLRSARRLRADDTQIDEMMVVAAAHAKDRSEVEGATRRLSGQPHVASHWNAIGASQLATHDFVGADHSARRALQIDPESVAAWSLLAASFAGLGWFSEATDCLDNATSDGAELNQFERWQVGRAINRWAMSKTHTMPLLILLTLVFRLLGVAFAITAPLVVREVRVNKLDGQLKELAEEAWAYEHRMRIGRGLLVFSVLAVWLLLIATYTS